MQWEINDNNYTDFINPVINGDQKCHGLIPRNLETHPPGCFAWAEPFPDEMLIPESDIQNALDMRKGALATLLDLRELYYNVLQSLDQKSYGYCWAFSTTKAMMYLRAIMGQPKLVLSGWMVGAIVKHYQNQGGFGGESLNFVVQNGIATLEQFPGPKQQYDTSEMRADAALRKCVGWWEGSNDPEKAFHQKASAHARGLPTIEDYSWWSHSVCGVWTENYKARDSQIDNSWTPTAGNKGLFRLQGNKSLPNGLWIPRFEAIS